MDNQNILKEKLKKTNQKIRKLEKEINRLKTELLTIGLKGY